MTPSAELNIEPINRLAPHTLVGVGVTVRCLLSGTVGQDLALDMDAVPS